jgi:hypothetical protein
MWSRKSSGATLKSMGSEDGDTSFSQIARLWILVGPEEVRVMRMIRVMRVTRVTRVGW